MIVSDSPMVGSSIMQIRSGVSADELLVETLPGFDVYLMPDRPTTLHGRIRSVYTELSGS